MERKKEEKKKVDLADLKVWNGAGVIYKDFATQFASLMNRLADPKNKKAYLIGLSSGLDSFDRLSGGLCQGRLYVVGARPADGKSTIAMNMAAEVARQGGKVLFFSLEMPIFENIRRIIGALSGMSQQEMIDAWKSTKDSEQDKQLTGAMQSAQKLLINFYFRDAPTSIKDIEVIAETFRGLFPDDDLLIVIDYLGLVKSTNDRLETIDKYADNIYRVKDISKKNNLAVLMLAQLNRASTQDKPKKSGHEAYMSDFKGSSAIEDTADVAACITYEKGVIDAETLQPASAAAKAECFLVVIKNRSGAKGEIKMIFEKPIFTFYEKDYLKGQ